MSVNEPSTQYDNSILIHDDDIDEASELIEASTASQHQSLFTTKSVNLTTPKSARFSTTTTKSPKKHRHARNVSVGNMVPNKYLKNAPALIALLDKQNASNTLQLNAFRPSKSMPDYFRGRNGSNSSIDNASPTDDFISPVTKSEDNVFSNDGDYKQESEENTMQMIINDDNDNEHSVILHHGHKEVDFEQFIPSNEDIHNDEIVDMQSLAMKAAQEFTNLANENDYLYKENETLKAKFDDLLMDKEKLTEQMTKYEDKNNVNSQIMDDIESLKSEQLKWQLEKKVLMEQLNNNIHNKGSDDEDLDSLMMGKAAPKLKNDTSEDSNRLMMESLAKITREKNALLQTLEQEKNLKREYEKTIANLNKSLSENERDRRILSENLTKQQKLYQSLRQNAKKKEESEIDNIVHTQRTLTLEQEKKELFEAVDEQKAYIQQLEAENQQLMNAKIKDDDLMFSELKQLKTHRFARSQQLDGTNGLDAISNLHQFDAEHNRHQSHSMSNYSHSGLNIFNHLNAPLYPQSVRQMQINLDALDQGYDDDDHDDAEHQQIDQKQYEATPSPKKAKKVGFAQVKDEEKEKRKMDEQMFKINAEIEFFLMTCIAVKTNLVEEYENKAEVMTEDAFKLYELVQKEHVSMNKFNIWIEMKLREKYDLPKLEGFGKFMEKYQIKDKVSAGITKTKKLAKNTGDYISEMGTRIRAYSKSKDVQHPIPKTPSVQSPAIPEDKSMDVTHLTIDAGSQKDTNQEVDGGKCGCLIM